MKRFIKRLSVVLAAVCFCGVLFSCQRLEDVLPESYGEWDGNYIYYRNGKCKTTGEDFERLVETVDVGGRTYAVIGCLDSALKGDDLYTVLVCGEEEADSRELDDSRAAVDPNYTCVLVRYNIPSGKSVLLFDELPVERNGDVETSVCYKTVEIGGVYADRVVLKGYAYPSDGTFEKWTAKEIYYGVGLDGDFLEEVDYSEWWQQVCDECFVTADYTSGGKLRGLRYRKGAFGEPKQIFAVEDLAAEGFFEWAYVEQDGVKGIRIEEWTFEEIFGGNRRKLKSLRFFDLDTERLGEALTVDKFADFYGEGDYVHTYLYEALEYYGQRMEKRTVNVETQNEIGKITYGEEIRLERFIDLKEKKNYYIRAIRPDVVAYVETSWMNAFGCVRQNNRDEYYEYNVRTGKRKEIKSERIEKLADESEYYYERRRGRTVGEYVYYIHEESISGNRTVYLLHRYRTSTGETDVMQLWEEYDRNTTGTKYCGPLWFDWAGTPNGEAFKQFTAYDA